MQNGVGSGGKFPEGSGRFRRVLVYAPEVVGSGKFRKVGPGRSWRVPESSGTCWCRFRRQGSEGYGGFRRVPARVGVGSGGRVQVPESSGVVCCFATLTGAAM